MRACLAIAASFLALAACQKPPGKPTAPVTSALAASPAASPTQQASATPAEPLDPFMVAIDAERWLEGQESHLPSGASAGTVAG